MAHFELPGIRFFIGIDPGANGGIAVLGDDYFYGAWALTDRTPHDIAMILKMHGAKMDAMLENVHAFPAMSKSSTMKLGKSMGFLEGCLVCYKIRYELVPPQTWQKALGCLSHGDKTITKRKAQQLYPDETITHATADAILIAEHCRRTVLQREGLNVGKQAAA